VAAACPRQEALRRGVPVSPPEWGMPLPPTALVPRGTRCRVKAKPSPPSHERVAESSPADRAASASHVAERWMGY